MRDPSIGLCAYDVRDAYDSAAMSARQGSRTSIGSDHRAQPRSRASKAADARILAWGALLGFYYATAPGNRTEADDAFWYACLVRDGSLPAQLADSSSHLLYLPLMTTIYRLALRAGVLSPRTTYFAS